jgi:hypothetical protein
MAQKATLMGTSGGSGSKKKKTSTTTNNSSTGFSVFKPINTPTKLTGGNIVDNIKDYNPKPVNTGQGPTIEKTKSTTKTTTTTPTYNGGSGGGGGGTVGAPKTSTPKVTDTSKTMEQKQKEKEKEYQTKYEQQIKNELDRYEKQLRDELSRYEQSTNSDISRYQGSLDAEIARLQQQGQNAIGRNNEYLAQQIAQLQDQRVAADQQTINLMNRRGAFYSGGTDYFLAENQRATQQATGNLQSEIGARNTEIEEGNMMAAQQAQRQFADFREKSLEGITMTREQAMGTLNMMREQAPDKVRQLVDDALERQWAKDFQMEQFDWQKTVQQKAWADADAQRAAAAARSAASQSLAERRFQAQQQQQAWENQRKEQQYNIQAAGGTSQGTQYDQASLSSFMSRMNSFSSPQQGVQAIQAYIDRGGSQKTAQQMMGAMNQRFGG